MSVNEVRNTLVLLKNDATRLYERVKYRAPEYLTIFSMKRTREHFPAIFENRYKDVKIADLKVIEEEVIIALDRFYSEIENIYWFLKSTEDMPNKVETQVYQEIKKVDEFYKVLMLYLDAELGVISEEEASESADYQADTVDLEELEDESVDFPPEL